MSGLSKVSKPLRIAGMGFLEEATNRAFEIKEMECIKSILTQGIDLRWVEFKGNEGMRSCMEWRK
eukprot:scaffold545084_cov19-Prasinocladus_malaysianus.AAC.1